MCEIKTIVVSVCSILLVTASFCIYQVYPERKVGHHSKIEGQVPGKKDLKKYCLNGGECYYLIDEDIVGCNSAWFNGGYFCEIFISWT